ncbi:MAG: adenylate kinase [Peptoniphilaceae bacterium]|nr:adenylate kinase [Peptoniphilaceae bacterium]
MKLVLLGPPGAGKGTQAKKIEQEFGLKHISTGDIFRENIKNKTPLGEKVQAYLDGGNLVPDELTIAMVWDRLDQEQDNYLLDGFPRTIEQADALTEGLQERGQALDHVICIEVDAPTLVKRLSGRRSCPECGAVYHVVDNPPTQEGICDVCGHELVQRADDKKETVAQRLDVYRAQTEPLIAYYEAQGNLVHIDGDHPVDDVFAAVRQAIDA